MAKKTGYKARFPIQSNGLIFSLVAFLKKQLKINQGL